MTEQWKRIDTDGWYEVSSLGRVRSWRAKGGAANVRAVRPRLLSTKPGKGAYIQVNLTLDGRSVVLRVHRLVAIAFLGPPPGEGYQAAHWNGDRFDNRAQNLRWATPLQNAKDRYRHGTMYSPVCRAGLHEMGPDNADYVSGARTCKACRRDRQRARRASVREAHLRPLERP